MMEADSGVRNTVDSLLQLSKIRLNLVIQGLAAALETLSKVGGDRPTIFVPSGDCLAKLVKLTCDETVFELVLTA